MTTNVGATDDAFDAVLVTNPIDPPRRTDRVVVTPGGAATFDGDRWRLSLQVIVDVGGASDRYRFGRSEIFEGIDRADRAVRESDPELVVLRGRDALYTCLPRRTVRSLERRLASATATVDATLVARADGDCDDVGLYDRIVDEYDRIIDEFDTGR